MGQTDHRFTTHIMKILSSSLPLLITSASLLASSANSQAGEEHGFYLGADVGAARAESSSLREFPDAPPGGKVRFNTGARLSLDAGYRFNDWLSLGAETGFIVNEIKGADAALLQAPILAVVEFRMPNKSPLVPFIGGGPGVSFSAIGINNDSLNGGTDVDGAAADAVFAWQVYGGVRFKITDSLSLGAVYKYFAADAAEWDVRNNSQSIRFGKARVLSIGASLSVSF
jgi:opacity protein-like surface antigen